MRVPTDKPLYALPPSLLFAGGTLNWDCPIQEATGDSVTLFDFKPGTGEHYGDPIADVYAVIARPNNAILALADGCNCGPKSRDAARRAVRGSIDYLNRRLFEAKHTPKTTQDVINVILQSFDSAQKCILQTDATTTSLCVAVVCELARPVRNKNWCVCMVNVGSSACYVWSNRKGIVQEVTYRCASDGSCLGHVIGDQPDKANLSCGFLPVHENDTIFLATSGISDNFDPVVLHEAGAKEVALDGRRESDASALANTTLLLSSEERETAKLSKLTELLLRTRTHKRVENLSAQLVTETLIDYAIQATDEKRRFLERCWNDDDYVDAEDKSAKEHEDLQLAEDYPGKVDHASVVAYKVGYLNEGQRPSLRKAFMYSPKM